VTRAPELRDAHRWKALAADTGDGWYDLRTEDVGDVPVRLFLTPALLDGIEDGVYRQIVNAARFPGARLVVITPDVHHGYGVPVGCAILSDADGGAIALGPVGFDIGCGMVSMRSEVPAERATHDRRLAFNREVMAAVAMGVGESSTGSMSGLDRAEFERLVRGGAEYYARRHGTEVDRSRAERHVIPVDDSWQLPRGRMERGMGQLGTLGGGNHFIELQRSVQTGTLFVQVHTGSRGFGHGLAEMYFAIAKDERPDQIRNLDEAWFAADSPRRADYLNAVAAAGNYAIINRLVIADEVARAFRKVFKADLELVYEISHNLVQRESHPDFGEVWVHRKGATRAFPAGHPGLARTPWADTGHPVLIPGSNRDASYILRPRDSAKSGYTVNHGSGRRMSRAQAKRSLDQADIDRDYKRKGIVVNLDGRVPIDEAGPAYKPSRQVIVAVTQARLAEIEHELWPLASLKGV
jgi:tRNA-splicing ligase RtcB